MASLHHAIRDITETHMANGTIGGAVTLVQRDGEIVDLQAGGHADFDASFVLRSDSIFAMMSLTKPFAAACAMILVSEGRLDLDAPVSRFIPAFATPRRVRSLQAGETYPPFPPSPDTPAREPRYDWSAARREITVRHLLNFTSGLQTIGIPNGAPRPQPGDTLTRFIPRLADAPLEFEPGTQWHYSNTTGYDVLGLIVEIVSGSSFQTFAREHLLDPLGMAETRFGAAPDLVDRIVPLGFLANEPVVWPDYASGSAGLFSTATDYVRFAEMLLDGGVYRGRRVMAADAVAAMRRRQIGSIAFPGIRASEYALPVARSAPGYTYGFGVGILDEAVPGESVPVGSYGWDGVGTRRLWIMPSLRTILVMLMPGVGTAAEPAHRAIEAAVVDWASRA